MGVRWRRGLVAEFFSCSRFGCFIPSFLHSSTCTEFSFPCLGSILSFPSIFSFPATATFSFMRANCMRMAAISPRVTAIFLPQNLRVIESSNRNSLLHRLHFRRVFRHERIQGVIAGSFPYVSVPRFPYGVLASSFVASPSKNTSIFSLYANFDSKISRDSGIGRFVRLVRSKYSSSSSARRSASPRLWPSR